MGAQFVACGGAAPAKAGSPADRWGSLWAFFEQQPGYKLSDTRPHAAGAPQGYGAARALMIAAARGREMRRLGRSAGCAVAAQPAALLPREISAFIAAVAGEQGRRASYEFARCDVGSMRRLRVTRGVCLPADYPVHVVCGSKDVIHSWAVPGLGIKIDCIPGYNSHRRVLFRWRGLYWGQCMEVCGRYHH